MWRVLGTCIGINPSEWPVRLRRSLSILFQVSVMGRRVVACWYCGLFDDDAVQEVEAPQRLREMKTTQ